MMWVPLVQLLGRRGGRPLSFQAKAKEWDSEPKSLESRFWTLKEDTAKFHRDYWTNHNNAFNKERTRYIARLLTEKYPDQIEEKKTLSSKEMSVFYRSFLDSRRELHWNYNLEWQKRNARLLYLSLALELQKLLKFFSWKT